MSGAEYVPTRDDLHNVIALLHENGIYVRNSRAAYENLKQYEANPSFCILLANVFQSETCPVPDLPLPVAWTQYRQLAGITLKNNIESARHALGETAVKEAARCALQCLKNPPDARIARASALIIVKITSLTSFDWWMSSGLGDLASTLLNDLLPAGGLRTLGALYTLQYLMEDLPKQIGLSSEQIIVRASQLSVTDGYAEDLKRAAFRMCFNIYEQSSLLDWNVDTLSPLQQGLVNASFPFFGVCTTLLESLQPTDVVFKILVLRSCLFLVDYFDYFVDVSEANQRRMCNAWINGSITIICSNEHSREGGTELVAAAIELITYILEGYDRCAGEGLIAYLAMSITGAVPTLLTALIQYVYMSDDEVQTIMDGDDYRIRDTTAVSFDVKGGTKDISADDVLDEGVAAMTLRSSSLKCIDSLCSFSRAAAFALIVEKVEQLWGSPDWKAREAGIVLVGTMASGCSSELESSLPTLAQQLICFVEDASQHVCVVSIAMWSLSRLMESAFTLLPDCFHKIVSTIMARLQSSSKRIQHTSVTAINNAFAVLQNYDSTHVMAQHYPQLLSSIYTCLPVYSTTNLSLLIDLLSQLVGAINDRSTLMELSTKLKEERARRAKLFEESYTRTYISNEVNSMVDKDIFSLDRALIALFSVHPDSAFGCDSLNTWCGVLQDIISREIVDDPDLIFNTLLICCGYVNTIPTASLEQWIMSSSWMLPNLAYQLLSTSNNSQIISAALMMLIVLVRSLCKNALPQGMHNVLLEKLATYIADEDDPQQKSQLVKLISFMVSNLPSEPSAAAMGALAAANAAIRSDAFGTSLLWFIQMAYDLCRPLETIPSVISGYRIDVICSLLSQADNTFDKSVATIRLFNALGVASFDFIAKNVPCVLRVVYSWQQAAIQFPGTLEVIQCFFHSVMQHCGNILSDQLALLPPAFREMIVTTYQLS